jgi:hypothetical protein
MVDYQTIAELVSQIPVDTWNLLREIKQRRPAMMCRRKIEVSPCVQSRDDTPWVTGTRTVTWTGSLQ